MSEDISLKMLQRLGRAVKNSRKAKGFSQARLGVLYDMDKASICRLEKGKSNVTISSLNKIAKALNISVSELLV